MKLYDSSAYLAFSCFSGHLIYNTIALSFSGSVAL